MERPTYALVTGASRGLGRRFAEALAARQRNLILVARSKDKLEGLADELRASHSVLVEPLAWDLARPMAGRGLATELRDRGLAVDLLVNSAGVGVRGEFWSPPLERQVEMVHLNAAALVELTCHLVSAMVAKGSGAIINVSSTAAFQPMPYAAVYAGTKALVTSFSMALAEEVRPYGVTVVTVCPGRLRSDDRRPESRRKFFSIEQAREHVVDETLRVLDGRGGLVVPGNLNKFGGVVARLLPRALVPRLVAKLSRPSGWGGKG
jgi:uncharacterized protein